MECSSCGAFYKKRSATCPECGARQIEEPVSQIEVQPEPITTPEEVSLPAETATSKPTVKVSKQAASARRHAATSTSPTLITFPGVSRTSIPEWRKELGERVREVQERKAREATLEMATVGVEGPETKVGPLLELLPQTEIEPMNPIVVAALRRIEKANDGSYFSGNNAVAVAYEEQIELEPERDAMIDESSPSPSESETVAQPDPGSVEKTHNLVVVPPAPVTDETAPEVVPKPKRLIRDDHDPALNYLDSIPTTVVVDSSAYRSAPVLFRIAAAVIDLAIIGLLALAPITISGLTSLESPDPQSIGIAGGAVLVMGFLYLTINTAMTGRTLAMRLFSLRVVDARTGLIPTGSQSAGRALLYLASLLPAGIALLYTFVDSDRQAFHDKVTRTAVVRA